MTAYATDAEPQRESRGKPVAATAIASHLLTVTAETLRPASFRWARVRKKLCVRGDGTLPTKHDADYLSPAPPLQKKGACSPLLSRPLYAADKVR
jgi:hypothetical protein